MVIPVQDMSSQTMEISHEKPAKLPTSSRKQLLQRQNYKKPLTSSSTVSSASSPASPPQSTALIRGSACRSCRRKKHKCDAAKPACGQCVRVGTADTCQYDPTTYQARVESLQGRIQFLEDQITRFETIELSPVTLASTLRGGSRALSTSEKLASHSVIGNASATKRPNPAPFTPYFPLNALPDFGNWWMQEEIPHVITNHLIYVFIQHRHQVVFELNVPRFLKSLELPFADRRRPHPCLLDAMVLIGAHFTPETFGKYEPVFLGRLRRSLANSLANADRIVDFIRASATLSFFYFFKGRFTEGYNLCASTMRFSVGCGMNSITSPDPRLYPRRKILGPPADAIELEERVHAFWMLFCLDRSGALTLGQPVACPQEEITSMWPSPELQDIDHSEISGGTINRLFLNLATASASAVPDSVACLRAKAVAILYRASRVSARLSEPGVIVHQEIWNEYYAIDHAICHFTATLPSMFDQRGMEYVGGRINPSVVSALTSSHGAALRLHNACAEMDATSYQKCLNAARAVVSVVQEIRDADFPTLHIVQGVTWAFAFEVLAREARNQKKASNVQVLTTIKLEMEALLRAMTRLAEVFPKAMSTRLSGARKQLSWVDSGDL
ncbi:hypothetical protein BOTBODRAFT_25571 [Botryobasidium botryosum FD-172 SS1]|uniref:Zn(2)-C6 fungal-type domain-containing protein n=1 Tax=Botryobasidium botryosum (strain FD-172 SS1) TaxID=930990 RepID=A0A067NAH8_BOTB1|nr:hypothetical protein BOTBODRAFT_25571 [Botryobasidium botryosum FD-172 SS1]